MVGNSGSGKTTLGRALAGHLGVRFVELDSIVHQPGWEELPLEELRARVEEELTAPGWVVDGNYRNRVGDLLRDRADTVVWIDLPRWLVVQRVVRRTLRRVITREELWNGNREPWTNLYSRDPYKSIIVWSWTRHVMYREQYELERAGAPATQQWVRLRSQAEARRWLSQVVPEEPSVDE